MFQGPNSTNENRDHMCNIRKYTTCYGLWKANHNVLNTKWHDHLTVKPAMRDHCNDRPTSDERSLLQ